MGRHRVPTAINLTRGNPSKRPINTQEPKPPAGDMAPPAGLDGLAGEKWVEMVALLSGMGVYTAAERSTLQRYCLMWEQWWGFEKHCKENGCTQLTQTGYSQVTAEATLCRALRSDLLSIERQFGMTPVARVAIKVTHASAPEDPLEAYLKIRVD